MTSTIGQISSVGSVVGADLLEVEIASTVASGKITVAAFIAAAQALIDHGALTGLADDDHGQYHNDTRGDARYYTQAQITAALALKASLAGAAFTGPVTMQITSADIDLTILNRDAGLGYGSRIVMGNNNGATPSAAYLHMRNMNSSGRSIWVDNGGLLRIHTVSPSGAGGDTDGTIVGTQSSSLDSKDVLGDPDSASLWDRIRQGAMAVRRFVYKPQIGFDDEGNEVMSPPPYGGEEFSGVIIDFAPHYGMDRDDAHPAGKSLNEINVIGDLMLAVAQLQQRVAELEQSS